MVQRQAPSQLNLEVGIRLGEGRFWMFHSVTVTPDNDISVTLYKPRTEGAFIFLSPCASPSDSLRPTSLAGPSLPDLSSFGATSRCPVAWPLQSGQSCYRSRDSSRDISLP